MAPAMHAVVTASPESPSETDGHSFSPLAIFELHRGLHETHWDESVSDITEAKQSHTEGTVGRSCVRPSEYVALGDSPRPELFPERYEGEPCNDREDRNKYPHVVSSYVIGVDRVVNKFPRTALVDHRCTLGWRRMSYEPLRVRLDASSAAIAKQARHDEDPHKYGNDDEGHLPPYRQLGTASGSCYGDVHAFLVLFGRSGFIEQERRRLSMGRRRCPAPVDLSVELSDVAAVAVHPVFLKKRLASAAGTRTSQAQHTAAS